MASSQPKRKYRKRRELTPEQKQAAIERLAAAREKRLKENPPQYKNIHPDVLSLDDDNEWSVKNVKEWIRKQKDRMKALKQSVRRGDKGAEARYLSAQYYINNMETYLRTGVWLDLFWGEEREHKTSYKCEALAYYHTGPKKGQPKRMHGVYYSDLNATYTRDMGDV